MCFVSYARVTFSSCDLDFKLMTLTHKLDVDILSEGVTAYRK